MTLKETRIRLHTGGQGLHRSVVDTRVYVQGALSNFVWQGRLHKMAGAIEVSDGFHHA